MRVKLAAWAATQFDPPPHRNTLHKWRAEGRIVPAPKWMGNCYWVEDSARVVFEDAAPAHIGRPKSNGKKRLADRI